LAIIYTIKTNRRIIFSVYSISWSIGRFMDRIIELSRGAREYGRPAFNPTQIRKMCLLTYFYDLSVRQDEVYVNENLPAKYFVGLGLDQTAPDHSTLTVFRKQLIREGDLGVFEDLLADIIRMVKTSGLRFGNLQIIDSVHTEANVNTGKVKGRNDDGKTPRDPDAKWGMKEKQKAKDQNGQEVI
jgi:hypothetical protein